MKAKELSELLTGLVEKHGDVDVVSTCDDDDEGVVPYSRELSGTSNPLFDEEAGKIVLYVTPPTLETEEHVNLELQILQQLSLILGNIPKNTGLTDDEIRLEVAARIIEGFPKNIQADVDVNLKNALNLITEAGAYYGAIVHAESRGIFVSVRKDDVTA